MTATANLGARLGEAVGAERVVCAAEELATYAIDGIVPGAIVRPAAAEGAMEVVRFAAAEKLGLLPLGSRSKCDMGMAPSRYDIALDMTSLRNIAHYDPGDMTLSVDAGMPLRELEIFLKRHGQFLPLAVPCFESTTAGGTIASGIDSALRMQYGGPRDFLIGAEFVNGTGQLCRSGGRVVKNVTGYDLHKLLIGSLGTLGAITRVNFRTFPLPALSGGHVASFANCESAIAYRKKVEKSGLPLGNLEALSPEVSRMIRAILQSHEATVPAPLEREEWHVYSSYEGSEAIVRRISGDLSGIAKEAGASQNEVLEPAEDESLGGMLREAYEWMRWGAQTVVVCRLALPEVTAEILMKLGRLAEGEGVRGAVLARAAGVVYFAALTEEESEAAMTALGKVITGARALAASKNGHATLLHAPTEVKAKLASGAPNGIDFALQQRVKLAFDPSSICAPSRIVGGL